MPDSDGTGSMVKMITTRGQEGENTNNEEKTGFGQCFFFEKEFVFLFFARDLVKIHIFRRHEFLE